MEQLQHIYNDLRDNNELDIVEKYGNIGKYYTIGIACKTSLILLFLLSYRVFQIRALLNFLLKFL